MARAVYWLTPPTKVTFIVSVVLVILALLVRYAHVSIPGSQCSRFRDAVDRLLGAARGQPLSRTLIALPQLNVLIRQEIVYGRLWLDAKS